MKALPASVLIVGVTSLLAAVIVMPVSASAADWSAPSPPQSQTFPHPYTLHDDSDAAPLPLMQVADTDPHRYTRERVSPGYGGATLEHNFGIHPHDSERPRYRHYYPYVWGGYAFSAPYFVSKGDYSRPEYDKPSYGKAQKYRWGRDYKRPDQWEDGRW